MRFNVTRFPWAETDADSLATRLLETVLATDPEAPAGAGASGGFELEIRIDGAVVDASVFFDALAATLSRFDSDVQAAAAGLVAAKVGHVTAAAEAIERRLKREAKDVLGLEGDRYEDW